ncbi:MAG: hypothetical protein ABL949_11890 [Fimbriimonadaceae bacterium]
MKKILLFITIISLFAIGCGSSAPTDVAPTEKNNMKAGGGKEGGPMETNGGSTPDPVTTK